MVQARGCPPHLLWTRTRCPSGYVPLLVNLLPVLRCRRRDRWAISDPLLMPSRLVWRMCACPIVLAANWLPMKVAKSRRMSLLQCWVWPRQLHISLDLPLIHPHRMGNRIRCRRICLQRRECPGRRQEWSMEHLGRCRGQPMGPLASHLRRIVIVHQLSMEWGLLGSIIVDTRAVVREIILGDHLPAERHHILTIEQGERHLQERRRWLAKISVIKNAKGWQA